MGANCHCSAFRWPWTLARHRSMCRGESLSRTRPQCLRQVQAGGSLGDSEGQVRRPSLTLLAIGALSPAAGSSSPVCEACETLKRKLSATWVRSRSSAIPRTLTRREPPTSMRSRPSWDGFGKFSAKIGKRDQAEAHLTTLQTIVSPRRHAQPHTMNPPLPESETCQRG